MCGRERATGLAAALLALVLASLPACPHTPKYLPPTETELSGREISATPLYEHIFRKDMLTLYADGSPSFGEAPLKVRFRVELVDDASKPRFEWDFGDGSPISKERNPQHVYGLPGNYTATVRVTDRDNKVGADRIEVHVLDRMR